MGQALVPPPAGGRAAWFGGAGAPWVNAGAAGGAAGLGAGGAGAPGVKEGWLMLIAGAAGFWTPPLLTRESTASCLR